MTDLYLDTINWIMDQGPIFTVGATMIWTSIIGLILLAATRPEK